MSEQNPKVSTGPKPPYKALRAFRTKSGMPPPEPFSLDTIKKRFLFSTQPIGAPTKAQRSGFCGEEESGEAPPAAEKASRFRGSGAIGGPEGAGNRNAATVCKGATKRHEGCPPPQGVPNIAQFDPTTNGGRILPGTGTLPCPRKKGNPPRGTSQSHRPSPIYPSPRDGTHLRTPRGGKRRTPAKGKYELIPRRERRKNPQFWRYRH